MAIVLPVHTGYHGKYEVGAEIEEAHPAHSTVDLRLNSRAEAFYANWPCLRASLRDSSNPWHGLLMFASDHRQGNAAVRTASLKTPVRLRLLRVVRGRHQQGCQM